MKKRKSCTLSQSRSLRDIQSLSRVRSLDSNPKLPSKTNSHASPRNKRQAFTRSTGARSKNLAPCCVENKKEIYKSLDSLFDLDKPFDLSFEDFPHCYPPVEERTERSSEDSGSELQFGKPEDFIEKLKPAFLELEPNVVLSTSELDSLLNEETELKRENLEKVEDIPILSEIEEDNLSSKMADNDPEQEVDPAATGDEAEKDPEQDDSEIQNDENQSRQVQIVDDAVEENKSQATAKSAVTMKDSTQGDKGSIYAPPGHPLPPGYGEGIVVGPGKHSESIMSSVPITESVVIQEMIKAEERANIIRKEIQDKKMKINELTNKEELSDDDTIVLRDLQTDVMQKVGELNDITRKLQRTIGLVDPSTHTFAKMVDMLPYPHPKCSEERDKEDERPCENIEEAFRECEKFAFPQIEYPEDKIPRVIVCGNSEDNFPQILVADSRPKSRGKKCLQNLTGKLTESLSLQEKLAKENAQLEGGKYKLEKELLEKDDAVECLQRKVRGLQDEMRYVVKENHDLNRKLVCLSQPQSQPQSPCSPPPCASSRSSPRPTSACRTPRPGHHQQQQHQQQDQQLDLSCKCSARAQEQAIQPPVESANACNHSARSPRSVASCRASRARDSPRLAGGGSRGAFEDCLLQNRPDMYNYRSSGGGGGGAGCPKSPSRNTGGPAVCPAEMEERLATYGNNTKYLGEQLSCIETEVRTLQTEFVNVQRERQQLEQQRKLLECAGPCATCVCCPEPPKAPCPPPKSNNQDMMSCSPSCNEPPEASSCAAQQLRELREQYARLQDDYKSKLCEVSRLRADAEALRRETREARDERERIEIKLIDAQERARVVEAERNDLLGSKEQLVEQEQTLLVAKQRFREAQDELEELRTMIRDQAAQLDDYRNKYLQAQQQVEEQRRQLDLMEMDNARMNENVTLEIGRVKNQFQEKLAELAPLPDILKQTQMKLQETQQLRMMAEHNCEDLSRELLAAKDKIDAMQMQMNDLQRELQALQDEKTECDGKVDELERKNSEMRNENERQKNAIARLEEQQALMQKRLDEKQHEVIQLTAMLEQVREDSARQVSRTKERCEAIKRSMQAQISDFEIQLAQCRAAAKTAQKERDEIRQKMQGQIGNLSEALQQAQGRIRSLQGHVDYLKVSYSNVFGTQGQGESPTMAPQTESPTQGYDSCDCNH